MGGDLCGAFVPLQGGGIAGPFSGDFDPVVWNFNLAELDDGAN
jgi:hypothetical protein